MANFNSKNVLLAGLKGDGVHIRYSQNSDGTNFTTTWTSGQKYIGIAVAATAPTVKTGYTWARFAGDGQLNPDDELDETSTNSLQNKVITHYLTKIGAEIDAEVFVDKYEGKGLCKLGQIINISGMDSLITAKIAVKEGDVFEYYGQGRVNLVACAYFLNGTLVSYIQTQSDGAENITITVPSGVDIAIFASYAVTGTTIPFSLKKVNSLVDKLDDKVNYSDVKNELGTSTTNPIAQKVVSNEFLNLNPMADNTTQDGFIYVSGSVNTQSIYTSIRTKKIPVKEGDKFYYRGHSWAQLAAAIFYLNDVYVSGIAYTPTGGNSNIVENIITIPSGVNQVIFQSGIAVNWGITNELAIIRQKSVEEENIWSGIWSGNVLNNKKYVACGDSFTEGTFSDTYSNGRYKGKKKTYPFEIGIRNNMTVINEAKSGSTMAYIDGTRHEFTTANGRYTQIPLDADYITLKFGINDSNQHVPIGTITDNVNTTYYGAWNIALTKIITDHPFAKIGIIISNGINNIDYVNATIAVAENWGIPYLNEATGNNVPLLQLTNKSVNDTVKTLRNNAFILDTDQYHSHPNANAHAYESTFVENFLRSL